MRRFILGLLFLPATLAAQTNLTGTWVGTYTFTERTPCSLADTKAARATLSQSGATVTGTLVLTDIPVDVSPAPGCQIMRRETATVPVQGALSGSSFSGTVHLPGPDPAIPVTGTASGDQLSLTFGDAEFTLTISLTREVTPTINVSGEWFGGGIGISTGCDPDVPQGGLGSLSLTQSGSNLTGTVTAEVHTEDCKTIPEPQTFSLPVSGSVSGNSLNLTFDAGEGLLGQVRGIVLGNRMTVTLVAGDSTFTQFFVRSGTPPDNFGGTWNGRIAGVATLCTPPAAHESPVSLALTQNGMSLTGTASGQGGGGNCDFTTPTPFTLQMTATVRGNSFSGTFTLSAEPGAPAGGRIYGTLVGNTLLITIIAGDTILVGGLEGNVTTPGASIAGSWGGTFNGNDVCDFSEGERILPFLSPLDMYLLQSGNDVTGNVLVRNAPQLDENCNIESTFPIVLPISGRMSGDVFSGKITVPSDEAVGETLPVSAMVSGNTMVITVNPTGTFNGMATMSRSSSDPPASTSTGAYSGTYTVAEKVTDCSNLTSLNYSGPLSGNVSHAGPTFWSLLRGTNTRSYDRDNTGSCTVVPDEDVLLWLSGQITGNSISGVAMLLEVHEERDEDSGDENFPFTATINGNTITGSFGDAEGQFTFTITRSGGILPSILRFDANPPAIQTGQASTLTWTTLNTTSVTIDNAVGAQPASGSVVVRPTATTTYTLTAIGATGNAMATTTVTVGLAGNPRVVITDVPTGFVQTAGVGGGIDTFTVTNFGDTSTTITVTPNGNFFTVSPSSFPLGVGTTKVFTIIGTPQPAGSYEGTITISGAGVPANLGVRVRMLVAAPPVGTVTARADSAREEVSSPAGQNAAGEVQFTNTGTATLTGIAVSDVPWIVPQGGVITIQPGQTVSISYTIDSSRRPDADSPLGGVTGKISLVFISGSTTGPTVFADGPGTSTVSVTLVHVARPNVSPGTPPALASGELALFVAGLPNQPNAIGDVLIANRQPTALSNIQLFMQGSGVSSQVTTIGSLVANSSVALPGLMKNVFTSAVPTGTAQLRGTDVSKISVAAIRSNTSSPVGTFNTAIPVFRSDRGANPGERILLPATLKFGNSQTNLYVQELAGGAGSFLVEILDNTGIVLSTRGPESIGSFGFAELPDIVPAEGTARRRTIRVTNTGVGTTRLNAYALVANTNEVGWVLRDPGLDGPANDAIIIPLLSAGPGVPTDFFVTNRSTSAVSVTLDERSAASKRRRAVSRATATPPPVGVDELFTFTIAPQRTNGFQSVTTGYVRVTAPPGTVSVTARTNRDTPPNLFNGNGIPAVQTSDALRSGQGKRFPGVDDGSAASRGAKVPGTFATHLALIETGGQSAVVRVTVQFAFAGGSLVSSSASVSKEYTLSPAQFLLISNLARDVIGAQRDSFGDLRNMTVDVEVISGSGAVIPFLQSIDNGSGDMIVRTE
jgi:hypothetical protein